MSARPLGSILRHWAGRVTGVSVFRHGLPVGVSLEYDFRRLGLRPATVFDVGANVGQSATEFTLSWPGARVHSFEPVSATYAALVRNAAGLRNVSCYQLALGDSAGTGTIRIDASSTMSSFVDDATGAANVIGSESVEVHTLDGFCRDHGVERIDFLKIDAEGYDLAVLIGATDLLSRGKVTAVLTEVGFGRTPGARHVDFREIEAFLSRFGFWLVAFYDQAISDTRRLYRANALFVRGEMGRSGATQEVDEGAGVDQ